MPTEQKEKKTEKERKTSVSRSKKITSAEQKKDKKSASKNTDVKKASKAKVKASNAKAKIKSKASKTEKNEAVEQEEGNKPVSLLPQGYILLYEIPDSDKVITIISANTKKITYLDAEGKKKRVRTYFEGRKKAYFQCKFSNSEKNTSPVYLSECKKKRISEPKPVEKKRKLRSLMGNYVLLYEVPGTDDVIRIISATTKRITYLDSEEKKKTVRTHFGEKRRAYFLYKLSENDRKGTPVYLADCKRRKILTEAQKNATKKYVQKHYETIATIVPKGTKDIIREEALEEGLSLNRWIKNAIVEKTANDELRDMLAMKG